MLILRGVHAQGSPGLEPVRQLPDAHAVDHKAANFINQPETAIPIKIIDEVPLSIDLRAS
jgi:hypothetical protein